MINLVLPAEMRSTWDIDVWIRKHRIPHQWDSLTRTLSLRHIHCIAFKKYFDL